MSINEFSENQKQALLDLVLLAMYADGHLASAEDGKIRRLLEQMGHTTDYDRSRWYDAAISRVRSHPQNPESARLHAQKLAQVFATADEQKLAVQLLDEIMASDGQVAPQENALLSAVKDTLKK